MGVGERSGVHLGKANDVQWLAQMSPCSPLCPSPQPASPPRLPISAEAPPATQVQKPQIQTARWHLPTHSSKLSPEPPKYSPNLPTTPPPLCCCHPPPSTHISSWTVSQPPDSSAAPTRLHCHPPLCLLQPPAESSFLHLGCPAYNHCPGLGSVCPDKDCHPRRVSMLGFHPEHAAMFALARVCL